VCQGERKTNQKDSQTCRRPAIRGFPRQTQFAHKCRA
jgi:hypothetical protein